MRLACIFLLSIQLLVGLLSPSADIIVAQDAVTILVMHEFDSTKLRPELAYLGSLLPQQLINQLDSISIRQLSDEEIAELSVAKTSNQSESFRTAVASASKKRDTVWLSTVDPAEKLAVLKSAEAAVATAREKRAAEPETSAVSDFSQFSKLEFHISNADGSLLKPFQPDDVTQTFKSNEISIYGSLSENGQWIILDLGIFLHAGERVLLEQRYYTEIDGIDALLSDIRRPLFTALLGRNYALLEFVIDPPTAELTIGPAIQTKKQILIYEDGNQVFSISHPGFITRELQMDLLTGQDYSIPITLARENNAVHSVDTLPSGASVYIDTRLAGISPLQILELNPNSLLSIQKEGYETVFTVISALDLIKPITLNYSLLPSDSAPEDIKTTKRKFLTSLGYLISSLPFSILSYGAFNMYYQAQEKALADYENGIIDLATRNIAKDELESKFIQSQLVFWPSLAASILLGAHAVYRLVIYIDSVR